MDDCFSIVPELAVAQLNLPFLNQIHPKIRFINETETDGVLEFLDIMITNNGSGVNTTFYKKPSDYTRYVDDCFLIVPDLADT